MHEDPNTMSPSEAYDIDESPKGGQRVRFGCAITLLLLLWVIPVLYLMDVPAPQDQDLRPMWSEVPESQNPLVAFVRKYRSVQVRHRNSGDLDANQHVLAAFDELLSTSPATWRWRGIGPDVGKNYLEDKSHSLQPALIEVINVTTLVQKRSQQQSEEISSDVAAAGFVDLLMFFQGMERAEGQLPQHMTLMDLRRRLLNRFEVFLKDPSARLSPATMSHLSQRLPELEPSRVGLQFTVRAEYELGSHAIRHWIQNPQFPGYVLDRPRALSPQAQFKPNLTLMAYGRRIRPLLKALEEGWPSVHQHLVDYPPLTEPSGVRKSIPEVGINATGAQVLHLVETGSEVLVEELLEQVVSMRLMTLQLALRQFELQHHRLPQQLSDLAPAILGTLPVDPGTGIPFHWNPSDRILRVESRSGQILSTPYWWKRQAGQASSS